MTQQIFSPSRFADYFRKYVFENRSRLGVIALTLILVPILFCMALPVLSPCYDSAPDIYNTIADPMWHRESTFFSFFFIVMAAVVGASFYDVLSRKTMRINLFSLPVSSFEKFAVYFSVWLILLPLLTLGGSFLADAIRVWFYSSRATEGILVDYISLHMIASNGDSIPSPFDMAESADMIFFCTSLWLAMILTVPALFTLGSSVWPKNSFMKTAAFIFSFNTAAGLFTFLGFKTFFLNGPMFPRHFFDAETNTVCWWIIGISIAITIFFYVVSYFRFKEWEVIKRW
ncbi:MAG: hypothetical protein K2I37_09580 [Muribaculaceae bacterium]|nr:hypothetical protein [Muribaculaceae bacterium]